MTDAILQITDGTTTISLISPNTGFHLINWTPLITDYKGGGTFQNPSLADWRQLRDSKWATASENFTITINGASPNTAAFNLQEIRRLLEKANQYWTSDWQNEPVWIEAKMKCETNTRYCLVVRGRLGNDRNFYDQPVTGTVTTLTELPLTIERRAWLSTLPNEGTATNISAVEEYDGRSYGNVNSSGTRFPTTANEVYISNKRNVANLTDIYNFDASGASFSANLLDAALPTTLFPSPAAVGDIVYFGIDTSVTDSGPFASLVFDIGTAASATAFTLIWEYWDGATWSSLTVNNITDNTNSFQNTGVNSVHWRQKSDWTTTSINGITAYWVRVRISALTGAFTNPTQQNRDIYSIVWNYIEIQESEIAGDISALIKIDAENVGDDSDSNPSLNSSRIVVGARSISRGQDFTSYINISDEQNNSDITIDVVLAPGITVFADDVTAPTGRHAIFSPVVSGPFLSALKIVIEGSLVTQYYGKFHLYLICAQSGGLDEQMTIKLISSYNDGAITIKETDTTVITNVADDFKVIDFGDISIGNLLNMPAEDITFDVQIASTSLTPDFIMYGFVLIPTDEWAGTFENKVTLVENVLGDNNTLSVDYLTNPKNPMALIYNQSDEVNGIWTKTTNGSPNLQSNTKQRLHFISMHSGGDPGVAGGRVVAFPEASFRILVEHQQRYLSLRGNR